MSQIEDASLNPSEVVFLTNVPRRSGAGIKAEDEYMD